MATGAGKLNERITIQAITRASDGIGGTVEAWADHPTTPKVWAKVTAKAGREAIEDGRMTASMITLFAIRNRSDLDETMRIVWRGSNYNIRGIRREGHSPQFLTIEAERGVA